jgi:predicted enzyme related to lactoylglutathione lyase
VPPNNSLQPAALCTGADASRSAARLLLIPSPIRRIAMPQSDHDRRIDYIEFPVLDLAESKRFYSSVFGWVFTDWGPDYSSYSDGRLSGGFARASEIAVGGPLIVLYSVDLRRTEESVLTNGGTIVKEMFEFPGGKRFHFRDPSGHELAVWSEG